MSSNRIVLIFGVCGLALLVSSAAAFRTGPIGGWNGSFASGGDCRQCHGAAVGNGLLEILGAPDTYTQGQTYGIIIRVSDPDQVGAGFQFSAEDVGGTVAGALIITDAVNTQPAPGDPGWITHTATGVDNAIQEWVVNGNSASYSLQWQAPSDDRGTVHLFAAGNAINDSFTPDGDIIYLTSLAIPQEVVIVCDDQIACTDDADLGGVCSFIPNDANCADNGLYCDGAEVCDGQIGCHSTGDPCAANRFCNEDTDSCVQCLVAAHCDNGRFCDGAETCDSSNRCVEGVLPCEVPERCNESADGCDECVSDVDCNDEDACTENICEEGICVSFLIDACGDDDGDGVPNGADDCAGTPPDQTADDRGCSCEQRDEDADGVDDCTDECFGTPGGAIVDERGCAIVDSDEDGDGIANEFDLCAATPAGAAVDTDGCSALQRGDADPDRPGGTGSRLCGAIGVTPLLLMSLLLLGGSRARRTDHGAARHS